MSFLKVPGNILHYFTKVCFYIKVQQTYKVFSQSDKFHTCNFSQQSLHSHHKNESKLKIHYRDGATIDKHIKGLKSLI